MKPPKTNSATDIQLDPNTFKKAMKQAKRVFAAKGIKSKADAYHLINQGFAEKRFNEADVRALQHAVSLVFDENSFGLAQTLLDAKDRGLKLADAKRKAAAAQPKSAAPEAQQQAPQAQEVMRSAGVAQQAPEQAPEQAPALAPEQSAALADKLGKYMGAADQYDASTADTERFGRALGWKGEPAENEAK